MTVPFLCVLLAFLLIYAAKVPVIVAQMRAPGGLDNRHPRDQQAQLDGWGKRALGAHHNAIEAFPPFAAGVFVAHLGGAPERTTAPLAIAFIVVRVVYEALYLANLASARSAVWAVGLSLTAALYLSPWF